MSNQPINTDPNAVQNFGSKVADLWNTATDKFSAGKKSRTEEFGDSSSLHKLVLDQQAAEHSHVSSEAEKSRQHQKDILNHVATTFGHDPSRSFSVESDGGKIKYSSSSKSSPTPSAARKPKSPVPTAPLSRRRLRRGK
jgi:hypothetical protein